MITAKIQTTSGKTLEATRNLQEIYNDVNAWNVLVAIWDYVIPSESIVLITIIAKEEDLWEKVYKKIEENEEKVEENE